MADAELIKTTILNTIDKSGKKLKPADVEKKVAAELGVDRKEVKNVIKDLTNSEVLTYAYLGGSYLIRKE
jgi:predicted regulator of amino acid metabolism with ACT domain